MIGTSSPSWMPSTVSGQRKMEDTMISSYGKYIIFYRVSYISGGAGFRPSTVLVK